MGKLGSFLAPRSPPIKLLLTGLAWMVLINVTSASAAPQWVACLLAICATRHALPYRTRKGSLHHQLHSRLDGWNATAPGRRSYYRNRYGLPSTQHPGPN